MFEFYNKGYKPKFHLEEIIDTNQSQLPSQIQNEIEVFRSNNYSDLTLKHYRNSSRSPGHKEYEDYFIDGMMKKKKRIRS